MGGIDHDPVGANPSNAPDDTEGEVKRGLGDKYKDFDACAKGDDARKLPRIPTVTVKKLTTIIEERKRDDKSDYWDKFAVCLGRAQNL